MVQQTYSLWLWTDQRQSIDEEAALAYRWAVEALRVKKMSLTVLITYAGALFIAAAIPGPGITAIVARALGSNFRETFFMGLGLVLGDMTYLTAVILGLAFVAQTFTEVFITIKIAGVLYLGYIAWKLWTAGLLPQDIAARKSTNIGLSFL